MHDLVSNGFPWSQWTEPKKNMFPMKSVIQRPAEEQSCITISACKHPVAVSITLLMQ